MKNKIEIELQKVKIADLSHFDKETNTYFIPKNKETKYYTNQCYLVELNNSMLDRESQININWNQGKYPLGKYLKIDVCKEMGPMIYVNGLVCDEYEKDTSLLWSGWLDTKQINLIRRL